MKVRRGEQPQQERWLLEAGRGAGRGDVPQAEDSDREGEEEEEEEEEVVSKQQRRIRERDLVADRRKGNHQDDEQMNLLPPRTPETS